MLHISVSIVSIPSIKSIKSITESLTGGQAI